MRLSDASLAIAKQLADNIIAEDKATRVSNGTDDDWSDTEFWPKMKLRLQIVWEDSGKDDDGAPFHNVYLWANVDLWPTFEQEKPF